MSDLQVGQSSKQKLPAIKVCWDSTTVPEPPVNLSIGATMQVTHEGIDIHAQRTGSVGADESAVVHISKEQIISIEVYLMPDIVDHADPSSAEGNESCAVIRTSDPFEVVPFFEWKFSSWKSYWMRALAKLAKEQLGIEAQIIEETERTRKVRRIRENNRD